MLSYSGYFISAVSYNMWPFETGFFHLAQCFQGSLCCNMYSYFIPLFLPNNIPANEYSTLNLSIYWLMDWFCQYSLFLYLCCSFHSEHFFSPVLCVGSRCTDFLFPMHQNPSGSRLLRKGYKTFDSHTFEKCLYFTLFFFFCGTAVWTQSFLLAKHMV
jgi:hypothetical protein